MGNNYDIDSILSAIDEINSKTKKKSFIIASDNINQIKAVSPANEDILPITEKLILEAEEHSNKIKKKNLVLPIITEDVLILDKEYNEQRVETINLEEIKQNIIDDLYSSLSKKVKKNTLKIIFDLRKKINDLEERMEDLKINKTDKNYVQHENNAKPNKDYEHLINEDNLELNEEHLIHEDNLQSNEENLIYEDNLEIDRHSLDNGTESSLSNDTIKTLIYQNSLIKKLENNEEKLRFKIVDLEKNLNLLKKKKINIDQNLILSESRIDLDNSKTKIEDESIFYRENYERLVVENNDIKKKLNNAKKQIFIFEQNKKDLENAFEKLNDVLSKNSIIKLNEPLKDLPIFVSSEESTKKSKLSSIHNLEKKRE